MIEETTFPTQIQQSRPNANKAKTYRPYHTVQPSKLQQSFYQSLRQTKREVKKAQIQYDRQMNLTHKLQRSVDTTNHKSLIKRVQFLKIYSNKKAMYHQKQLLQNKKFQKQKMQRKSIDIVKRRKLQSQLQHILRQNQEEEHICQLQSTNRKNRQAFNRDLALAKKRQLQSRHHDQIKKRSHQFMIRKRNMHTSQTVRSRNNYCQKVHEELKLIHHYQNLMGEVGKFLNIVDGNTQNNQPSKDTSTLCQTIDPGAMFITTRNNFS